MNWFVFNLFLTICYAFWRSVSSISYGSSLDYYWAISTLSTQKVWPINLFVTYFHAFFRLDSFSSFTSRPESIASFFPLILLTFILILVVLDRLHCIRVLVKKNFEQFVQLFVVLNLHLWPIYYFLQIPSQIL